MRQSDAHHRYTVAAAVAAAVGLAVLNVAADDGSSDLIRRVIAHTTQSGIAVRAIRHLEAGALNGKHHAWMDVETTLQPSGAFDWRVLGQGGSERTREKVFFAVLKAEAEAWRAGLRDQSAVSAANYLFSSIGSIADGRPRILLKPRRLDAALVDGTLTVDREGRPVLLEGRLAKSPSFWVNRVTVVKRFKQFSGVSLPVLIESLADIKMVGQSSFTMRYEYAEVNGLSVARNSPPASFQLPVTSSKLSYQLTQ